MVMPLLSNQTSAFPVVGVGGTSDDAEALYHFLRQLPRDANMAVVVYFNDTPPDHPDFSKLKHTIVSIKHGLPIAPNQIYLAPVDRKFHVVDGVFQFPAKRATCEALSSLDEFFSQIAQSFQEYSIGLLLGGNDQEGLSGLKVIHQMGGLVAVNTDKPEPHQRNLQNVLDSGLADIVDQARNLSGRIQATLRGFPFNLGTEDLLKKQDKQELQRIFELLQEKTRHDFSTYKRSTFYRRLGKRMAIRHANNISAYRRSLEQHPDEIISLYNELLIGVTRFFREPEVWNTLYRLIKEHLENAPASSCVFRAWCAACSTGQEAYTLAMVFQEALAELSASQPDSIDKSKISLQVFATDLNATSIAKARKGIYPSDIADEISPERLERFFRKHEVGYQINKDIREMIVFAPHNLITDPPFSRIDFLTCRNLLIYLTPDVHEVLISRFHHSLNPNGIMVLGSSESTGAAAALFTSLHPTMQIYRRLEIASDKKQVELLSTISLNLSNQMSHSELLPPMKQKKSANHQHLLDHLLSQHFARAAVLVNTIGDILYISGKTGNYLEPPSGKASLNILAMARPGIHSALNEAFHDALLKQQASRVTARQERNGDDEAFIDIIVQPVPEEAGYQDSLVVIFNETVAPTIADTHKPPAQKVLENARIKTIEQKLQSTRAELQSAREALQHLREEMQTSNEELMSTNEELQSTNEELTTSTEELRTMNEELIRSRHEAEMSLDSYTDLFDSAPVGYFILNRNATIQQANLAGAELLGMAREQLIGGHLSMFVTEADRPIFARCLDKTFTKPEAQECEVSVWQGANTQRQVRILALGLPDGTTVRVVIDDITDRKKTELALIENEQLLQEMSAMARIGGWEFDIATGVGHWTAEVDRIHEIDHVDVNSVSNGLSFFSGEWRSKLESAVQAAIHHGTPYDLELQMTTAKGNRKWIRTVCVPPQDKLHRTRLRGAIQDITEYKRIQLHEQMRNRVLELLAEDAALNEILKTLVLGIESQNPDLICSILLVDKQGLHFTTGAAPNLPDAYNKAIETVTIGMGVGSCGTAAFTGERVIVEDIHTHPYWEPYKDLAAEAGLAACWSEPIKDKSGKVLGSFAMYHRQPSSPTTEDIRLIEQTAKLAGIAIEKSQLKEELEFFTLVFQNSTEAMMVMDAEGIILTTNPAFTQITGYSAEEVKGHLSNTLDPHLRHSPMFQTMWQEIDSTGKWQGEKWNNRKNGEAYLEWMSINTIRQSDGSAYRYVLLFSDITQKKRSEELIWQQANFDPLTSLPNRRMFRDRIDQEIKKSRRDGLLLAILFIDLDRFKEVNDTLGHEMGDKLLVEAAERIRSCVRESDTVARLGGDEFTIILNDLEDHGSVERITQSILDKLSEPFVLGEDLTYVSASIGITLYPDDASDIDELLRNADQAMYAAKDHGRNRYHYFTPSMQRAAQTRMRLANDLRHALSNDEFRLHYQPIIALRTGEIHKAEALIRWHHPRQGLISPEDFIPIAEDTGLIVDIGDWVFKQAAREVKRFRETYHPDFQISINKSPVQFLNTNHRNHFNWITCLKELALPGDSFIVEITENLLLDMDQGVTEQLFAFRDAGIQVAIDDFGTGYSSLSYLKKFDIDYLKIDRIYVNNLVPDSNDLALCEAIIVMAHKLGLKVVAEGVESALQRDLLLEAGCDFAQGYFFSAPLPLDMFEQSLTDNKDKPNINPEN